MDEKQLFAIEQICELEHLLIEYGTGTGKTRVMIEACKVLVEVGDIPIIICVPNSLMEQMVLELVKWAGANWTDKNVKVLDSSYTIYRRREELKRGRDNVYVISTESLSYPAVREGLQYRAWAASFIDEGSRFRKYSKRTQTLKTLGSRSKSRYIFTGQLMVNTPADLFYPMTFLNPDIFETRNIRTFVTEYCLMGGYMGNQPIDIRPDRIDKLREIMDANRIHCELRDLRVLPDRELIVRHVDLGREQTESYEQMRDELKVEIEGISEPDFSTRAKTYAIRLLRLQEIAAGFARNADGDVSFFPSAKTRELVEILEESPDTPTIVWYWWSPERDTIATALSRKKIPFVIFGNRGAQTDFESGRINVFLSQMAKGGYGLNLPRAVRMIYHSLPWDQDIYLQSQERNMRRNTTAEYLEIIHLIARHTVDGYVRGKLLEKAGISSKMTKSAAMEMLLGV